MARKIDVMIKEPGKSPRHVAISNSLKNLQKTVGGYIETVTLMVNGHECVLIVNEEGKILGLPFNFWIGNCDYIAGTAVFCGVEGEEFSDVPFTFAELKESFPELWV